MDNLGSGVGVGVGAGASELTNEATASGSIPGVQVVQQRKRLVFHYLFFSISLWNSAKIVALLVPVDNKNSSIRMNGTNHKFES